MANRHEILWVTKSSGTNPHERIAFLGGLAADGREWRVSQQSAAQAIERGAWHLFVKVAGTEVDVVVAMSEHGDVYIKAATDEGDEPNTLLALPDFPVK